MKPKNILSSLALAIAFFSATIFSQINPILRDSTPPQMPEDFIVEDIKGKIVNKPVLLPKPDYPLTAKHAGIEGTVRVRIKVGVEGSVTEAEAYEGPEELKNVCKEAALKTRFVIARDANNEPIATEGHLTYTFEIKAANWIKIGYHLTLMQFYAVAMTPVPTIVKTIPSDWNEEQVMLKELKEIQKIEFATRPPRSAPIPPPMPSRTVGTIGRRSGSIMVQIPVPIPVPPPDEQIEIVRKLIPAFQIRLKDEALNAWKFKVGLGIGKVIMLSRNPAKRIDAVAILNELKNSAPPNAEKNVLLELDNLSRLLQKVSDRDGINEAIIYILSSK